MNPKSLLLLSLSGLALPAGEKTRPAAIEPHGALSFEKLSLHIEVDLPSFQSPAWEAIARCGNLLALPAEIVLEVEAGTALSEWRLTDGEGRVVLQMSEEESASMPVSELSLEAEERPLAELIEAFPAGSYHVHGRTSAGLPIRGTVELGHDFPGLFTVVRPRQGGLLSLDDAILAWSPAQGAVRYRLEVEEDATDFCLELTVPATRTSIALPPDLLEPGKTYEYSLVAEGDTDNQVEIEGSLVTRRGLSVRR